MDIVENNDIPASALSATSFHAELVTGVIPRVFPGQGGLFSVGHRLPRSDFARSKSSTSDWSVIQCPKCRLYFDKVHCQWKECSWLSVELVQLCLGQLSDHAASRCVVISSSDGNAQPHLEFSVAHPHLRSAKQKMTTVYKNLIRIQLTMEYRPCCHSMPRAKDFREFPVVESEEFYFTVSYSLCPSCSSCIGGRRQFSCSIGKVPRTLKSIMQKLTFCTTFSGRTTLEIIRHSQQRPGLATLNADCCYLILPYLHARDLNALSRVNSLWAYRTRSELSLFSRFLEAWDDSTKQGVYVNLDDYYTARPEKERLKIHMGGYVQSLPVEELNISNQSVGFSLTVNLQTALNLFPAVTWEYSRPSNPSSGEFSSIRRSAQRRSLGTDSTSTSTSTALCDLCGCTSTLPCTILEALPPKHRRLVEYMSKTYEVVLRGTPVFSRGSILFPYVVSEANARSSFERREDEGRESSEVFNKKSRQREAWVKCYGCYLCFILSS